MIDLVVRPLAEEDLGEAFLWYEDQLPGLGHEFLRAVDAAFAAIQRGPERYPLVYRDLRRVLVRRFPYKVYFAARAGRIEVLAVIHGRRHPRRWRRRA